MDLVLISFPLLGLRVHLLFFFSTIVLYKCEDEEELETVYLGTSTGESGLYLALALARS